MKKLIIYLAILGLAAPALAGARTEASVNASSTIKLGPVIKKINLDARGDASTTVKARVEQIKSAISEHKGEIKEKARGRWGEKAQMHLGNILEHFDRSVDKLENASMRLETQIGKLKVQGLAMASSTDLLARSARPLTRRSRVLRRRSIWARCARQLKRRRTLCGKRRDPSWQLSAA